MRSNPSIKIRGQRSISAAFVHRQSDGDQLSDCRKNLEDGRACKKRQNISLSDFLDRKLQKTSDPSKSVKGKERPFLSPGTTVGANRYLSGADADQKTKGPELNGIFDVVLEQFKHSKENGDSMRFSSEVEVQDSPSIDLTEEFHIQDLRTRKNAFGGLHGKPPAPKGLVVLGGDPRPKQRRHRKSFITKDKPLPHYNHYASGSGWWDSDMEGIDNDEVGFNEVWEGVGSATLGGLDWH